MELGLTTKIMSIRNYFSRQQRKGTLHLWERLISTGLECTEGGNMLMKRNFSTKLTMKRKFLVWQPLSRDALLVVNTSSEVFTPYIIQCSQRKSVTQICNTLQLKVLPMKLF